MPRCELESIVINHQSDLRQGVPDENLLFCYWLGFMQLRLVCSTLNICFQEKNTLLRALEISKNTKC